MAMWNPWRGCHKYSEGCKYCYIHKGDFKRRINTNDIVKTDKFDAPIKRKKNGEYQMKGNQLVYVCFKTDFLLEDADKWRSECFQIIKERSDLNFLFLTKRIERLKDCLPDDWEDGYENVIVGCTIENQKNADYRLSIFKGLPIKHKMIICQPLIEEVNLSGFLDNIELVVVGGESDYYARELNYDWVLKIRNQCLENNIKFEFRQCGTHFIKDGKTYYLKTRDLGRLAKKANINL